MEGAGSISAADAKEEVVGCRRLGTYKEDVVVVHGRKRSLWSVLVRGDILRRAAVARGHMRGNMNPWARPDLHRRMGRIPRNKNSVTCRLLRVAVVVIPPTLHMIQGLNRLA